jgi:hypothetical protein
LSHQVIGVAGNLFNPKAASPPRQYQAASDAQFNASVMDGRARLQSSRNAIFWEKVTARLESRPAFLPAVTDASAHFNNMVEFCCIDGKIGDMKRKFF